MEDRSIRIRCDCGAEVTGPRLAPRLACECGAVYAATVTQIRSPDGDAEVDADERATPK